MNHLSSEELSHHLLKLAGRLGACKAGIVTANELSGGPPSVDLTYTMPAARSAVCFAVAMDQDLIDPYFSKQDQNSLSRNITRTNTACCGIALEIATFLGQLDYRAEPVAANYEYRKDEQINRWDEKPILSHRYLAVRSGVGQFGQSGNVLTRDYGAAVLFGSVLTDAELIATDPLSNEENYCDKCLLCHTSCASGYMNKEEETKISMGEVDFTYSKRNHHLRCDYVCGGFTGLNSAGKWST